MTKQNLRRSENNGKSNQSNETFISTSVQEASICNLIHTIRNTQVILDNDLAALYQVSTKALNQAVSRNIKRFPPSFRFQLTQNELETLRSQFVTAKSSGRGGRRTLPYVFTEQGVSMLASVLRSDTAIEVSIKIIESFVELRHLISNNATLFKEIHKLELRQSEYQAITNQRFEKVFDYMNTQKSPKQKIFFDGQVFDAFKFLIDLVQQAKQEIILIDNYVTMATLELLTKKKEGVNTIIWTHPKTKITSREIKLFNTQYARLTIKYTQKFHDRFLILDQTKCYFIGASLKDAGKKSFGIARMEDTELIQMIIKHLAD